MTAAAGIRYRQIHWPKDASPRPIDGVLRESLEGASWSHCRRLVETGKVSIDGEAVFDPRTVVHPDSNVEISPRTAPRQDTKLARERIVYWDPQIIVADKPSGISTVAYDATERGTFDDLVRRAVGRLCNQRLPPLGVVHRIDKETSGLVVFARTTTAKRHLKQQFRFHTNHRAYLALATGLVSSGTIVSRLVADRGDGRRGSTQNASIGQLATTHVTVIEQFADTTLVGCRLETGRTHQIRIHLAESGHPIVGERVYGRRESNRFSDAPRLMLHAAELGFTHPTRELWLDFKSELPPEFVRTIERLRLRG